MLNGGPVAWSSKLQKVPALSSTEAEYMVLTDAMTEALWLRPLLTELNVLNDNPTDILVDNQGAINLSKNADFHKRTKHIAVKFHRIRVEQEKGEICFKYVESKRLAADFLTKPLGGHALNQCLKCVGLQEGKE